DQDVEQIPVKPDGGFEEGGLEALAALGAPAEGLLEVPEAPGQDVRRVDREGECVQAAQPAPAEGGVVGMDRQEAPEVEGRAHHVQLARRPTVQRRPRGSPYKGS